MPKPTRRRIGWTLIVPVAAAILGLLTLLGALKVRDQRRQRDAEVMTEQDVKEFFERFRRDHPDGGGR